jgi:hypothetical protein
VVAHTLPIDDTRQHEDEAADGDLNQVQASRDVNAVERALWHSLGAQGAVAGAEYVSGEDRGLRPSDLLISYGCKFAIFQKRFDFSKKNWSDLQAARPLTSINS